MIGRGTKSSTFALLSFNFSPAVLFEAKNGEKAENDDGVLGPSYIEKKLVTVHQ